MITNDVRLVFRNF